MKSIKILFIIVTLIPLTMVGQNKLDLGLFLGMSEHGGDVHSWGRHGVMLTKNAHFTYGLNATYNATQNLGIRLNYWGTKISGQDENIDNEYDGGHDRRNYSFESNLGELSLVAEYDLFGHKRWSNNSDEFENYEQSDTITKKFKSQFSPYVFAGLGLSFTDPTVSFNNSNNTRIANDIANVGNTYFQIPFGLGVKYDLSETIYLGLEASARIPLSDYLDGISEAANPDKNDAYQFIGAKVGFRLGNASDRDQDGIKDAVDACPDVPGSKMFNGCPDTDGDGIEDSEDECPQLAGLSNFNGCPDTDGDGIIDPKDQCPNEAGISKFDGCNDTDGDNVPDHLDKCPDEFGVKDNNGCPVSDKDKDGVADGEDACPNIFGTLNGCPDSDGDAVADKDDPCPNVKGSINGCPDTDGDGLADNVDGCPNKAGDVSNNGCPKVTTTKTTTDLSDIINRFRIDDIYFDLNKDNIKPEYYTRVDEAVAFAKRYPTAMFTITGHTDSSNSTDYNLNLAERRAKKVYEAMIKGGISPTRLNYTTAGENQPKGDNVTEEGKALNRRVEIRARLN